MTANHVTLIRTDAPHYRRHAAEQAQRARHDRLLRDRVAPRARAAIGQVLEVGARSLLGDRLWLDDRRVLTWIAPGTSTAPQRWYKEIDAVACGDEGPTLFVEIKTGATPMTCARAAAAQHAKIAGITAPYWPHASFLTIALPWGDDDASVETAVDVIGLDEVAGLPRSARRAMIRIAPEVAWERVLLRGWAPDPGLLQLARDNLDAPLAPTPTIAPERSAAFGDALSAALSRRGPPTER